MPGVDVITVVAAAWERHPAIPIVSVKATPQRLAAKHTPRPYHCLPKPFDVTELVKLVHKLLAAL